jgi:hypothetical protein
METLLALAPLLICPLMMVLMGGAMGRAVEWVSRGARTLTALKGSAGRGPRQ